MSYHDHDDDEYDDAPETQRGRMHDPAFIKTCLFGGDGKSRVTITLVSQVTGSSLTYKIERGKDKKTGEPIDLYFVSLLTGPNNETDFKYFGFVNRKKSEWVHGKPDKTQITPDAPGARAWRWFYHQVILMRQTTDEAKLEVWHEGRCSKCGRKLTVAESIERGIGPECWARANGE
jgi:hypothetical protein